MLEGFLFIMKQKLVRGFLLLIVLLIGVTVYWQHRDTPLNHVKVTGDNTATIFIPGYKGGAHTFNGMIHRLDHKNLAHAALKVNIDTRGQAHIQRKGVLTNNPLIQLTFTDNTDPQKQMQFLPAFMKELKTVYHIKKVNFVAHSMGGSVVLQYLENKQAQTNQYPTVNKFVAIGTPFGYITPDNGLAITAANIPANLKILNIAGDLNRTGTDTAVPLKSNENLKTIVNGHVASYRHVTITGNRGQAQHSALHENPQVDKLVAEFLWN